MPSTADAANDHVVNAVCLLDGDEAILEYAAVPFTVTATATPSSLPRTG